MLCQQPNSNLKSNIPLDMLLRFVLFLHEPWKAGLLQSDVLNEYSPLFRVKLFLSD